LLFASLLDCKFENSSVCVSFAYRLDFVRTHVANMKFLVVLAVLGAAFADEVDPQQQARAMMANRILTADPSTFIDCRHDEANGCAAKPGWKCQSMMKLCSPGNSPKLEATEGPCKEGGDAMQACKPLFRCNKDKTCAFVGPRACESESECNANVDGVSFECKELPKNAPGKRCWMKCHNDNECHGCKGDGTSCRIPENFRKQIGCCHGVCQRKSQC